MMRRLLLMLLPLLAVAAVVPAAAQRRITPVETPATMTRSVNETASDTSRINAAIKARSISYVDDRGLTIYVDTLTNAEWTDSTLIGRVPKMKYPLFQSLSVGVNVWDPLMRLFGQQHGLADVWAELDLHNRYKPTVEVGLGQARHRASTDQFLYRSPLSVFFRIGANYNFLFNSNPDYQLMAGLRYGFSPFSFSVDDVRWSDGYWGESGTFSIPAQHVTAGWMEFSLGLRVKLWGPISAGWTIKLHTILHQSRCDYGKPWYIPGYGTRGSTVTGAFSVVYTLPLHRLNKEAPADVIEEDGAVAPPAPLPPSGEPAGPTDTIQEQ